MAEEKENKPEEKPVKKKFSLKKSCSQFLSDFKAFAVKGNVIDMAVGVVVGASFTAIVNSLVGDILSPVIGKLTAGIDFKDLKWVISEAVTNEAGEVVTAEIAIKYGQFIHNIIYFLLVALSVFIFVRILKKSASTVKDKTAKEIGKLRKKDKSAAGSELAPEPEPAPAPVPEPVPAPAPEPVKTDETAELLKEIRDLLKAEKK